jgi:hypothetical protein
MQNGTKFFFRGQRIWEAVMDELLLKGLRHAKQVILASTTLPFYFHVEK